MDRTKREAASVAQLRRYQARLARPWELREFDVRVKDVVPVPRVFRAAKPSFKRFLAQREK